MLAIEKSKLPTDSLLASYQEAGAYTDCYSTRLPSAISLAQYIQAFYCSPLFRMERFILKWLVSKPSSDNDVRDLALGKVSEYGAWTVEGRMENQLLLCDFRGSTRSWLMVRPATATEPSGTRLYFGSAVVNRVSADGVPPTMGLAFRAMLGFHKLYSVALLASARRQLRN